MSEAPGENPIPVPFQENTPPDPNCSFYLKMKPLQTLKEAIEALVHFTFNNDGSGIVEADSDSLLISVEDNDNAIARLSLNSSGMIEFQNYMPPSSPMVGLSAPLRLISQGFPRYLDDDDDDTVVIFHDKETNRLHFEFETVPPSGTWVQMVENPGVIMFPNAVVFTAMSVPVEDVTEMNDYMSKAKDPTNDTVHIDWKENRVTFEIGIGKKWDYALEEAKESKKGKIFHGWFNWRYLTFMENASFLADQVTVYFLIAPEQHVLFQFHVAELADLFLLQKATLVHSDLSADTTQN